jgi:hypothetical protein
MPQAQIAEIESLPEENLKQTLLKRQRYEQLQVELQDAPDQLLADLYTAAFTLRKDEESQNNIPLTEHLVADDPIHTVPHSVQRAAREMAKAFKFFHWHLRFSQIMTEGGFDCVLGNPPWDRVKPQQREFFSLRCEEYSLATSHHERENALLSVIQSRTPWSAALLQEWEHERRYSVSSANFARESRRFPLAGSGELNLYSLFSELTLSLVGLIGRAGILVPTGIVTDHGNSALLRYMLNKSLMNGIIDFENRAPFFKSVESRYRFSLVTLSPDSEIISCFFLLTATAQVGKPDRHIVLHREIIHRLTPFSTLLPTPRSSVDASLISRLSANLLPLGDSASDLEWSDRLCLRRMFRKPDDAAVMISGAECERTSALPLIEGNCIQHYSLSFNSAEKNNSDFLQPRSILECEVFSDQCIRREDLEKKVSKIGDHLFLLKEGLLVFRRVARNTDERTLVSA